jgi:regulatory protein YycI of two-component signal transduction system YycFG
MDIDFIINDIINIKLTQYQMIFIFILLLIVIVITVLITKKDCTDMSKYNNKFKIQKF